MKKNFVLSVRSSEAGERQKNNISQSTQRSRRKKYNTLDLNHLSSQIIKAAINVHKELGPGLLESVYQSCLAIELKAMGLEVETEVPVPIKFRDEEITDQGFRLDLLVEDRIVVELKSVEQIKDIYKKQLLTYLKLSKKPLGLLINFNETMLKDGITRIINSPPQARDKKISHRVHRDHREKPFGS